MHVFQMLDCKWGPHNLDRFACSYNTKVSRYNSRFYQPGTENWDGENNWILPPISQISRVISHARACKTIGTLAIPMWKSSYFCLLLCEDGKHWNALVRDGVTSPKFKNLW